MFGSSPERDFLDALCAVQTPLFPQLRSLDWDVGAFGWNPIPLFYPPLDYVKIAFLCEPEYDTYNTEKSIARQLPALVPNLRVLDCQYLYQKYEIHTIMKEAIPQLLDLQVVKIKTADGVDGDMIAQCAKLPVLQKLSLQISEKATEYLGPFDLQGFPALQALHMSGFIAQMARVVSSFHFPHLKSLFIDIPNFETEASALQSCNFPHTLIDFTFRWASYGSSPDPFDVSLLQNLHLCPMVERVRIVTEGHSICVTDHHLEQMAIAWPCLQYLGIAREPRSGDDRQKFPRPEATFLGLQALVEHCPLLRQVQIALDATQTGKELTSPAHNPPIASHLCTLDLRYSPCGSASVIVEFLTRTFPALKNFLVEDWKDDAEGEALGNWEDVRSRLPRGRTLWKTSTWDFVKLRF